MQDQKSAPLSLNVVDWRNIIHSGIVFLAPLGVIYFGAIVLLLQTQGHRISLHDFVPNNFQVGAMALYILNRLLDISRKFVS